MLNYVWPMALIIVSNIVYNICAKSVPAGMNPFAALVITYVVAALVSGVLFFASSGDKDLLREIGKANWAPLVLGIVIVGLEAGFISAYKAGWPVSTAFIVQSAILAVALLLVGYLLYHEGISWNKIAGVAICLIGLILINYR